ENQQDVGTQPRRVAPVRAVEGPSCGLDCSGGFIGAAVRILRGDFRSGRVQRLATTLLAADCRQPFAVDVVSCGLHVDPSSKRSTSPRKDRWLACVMRISAI